MRLPHREVTRVVVVLQDNQRERDAGLAPPILWAYTA